MNSSKKTQLVNSGDTRILVASLNYPRFQYQDMITWKKKVYTPDEVKKNPLRLLFAIEDNGVIHSYGKELLTNYRFTEADVGKYIKFYSYNKAFNALAQCIVFYVEDKSNTSIRIRGVERVGSDSSEVVVGQKIKLKVNEYSVEEKKISTSVKKNIKWMVKVGDNGDERLIINGVVQKGDEVEFRMPEEWDSQTIILMPYLNQPTSKISVTVKVAQDLFRFYYCSDDFVLYNKERYSERLKEIMQEYNKVNSHIINQQVDFYYEDKIYKANSYATLFGRDGLFNFIGGFKNIYVLNEYDILFVTTDRLNF